MHNTIIIHKDGKRLKLSTETIMGDVTPYEASMIAVMLALIPYTEFDFSSMPNSFLRHFEYDK